MVKQHQDGYTLLGTPDLTGSYRGYALAIEVKRPGEKPTPHQMKQLREWRQAGAFTLVAFSVEDARALLDEIDAFIDRAVDEAR